MSDAIERLFTTIEQVRHEDASFSRTAKLIRDGLPKTAKKVVEEAAEVGFEAVRGDLVAVVQESADLLYNLAVLWAEIGVTPSEVWAEMDRRERLLGIAEKLPKQDAQLSRPKAARGE